MKHRIFFLLFIAVATLAKAGVTESKVNHSAWDKLLQKNVSAKGNVNYDGFKVDKAELDAYLKMLSNNAPNANWSKSETMAYWINAYNAFTIKLILDNYPVKSIMEINGGKAWDLKFIKIGGVSYSLNNIEHDMLRKKYKDARIHFAVNCASISCPKLNNRAFFATDLEKQLEAMATSFINNPTKNKITDRAIEISKLFDWYKDDFGGSKTAVINYINKYSKTKTSTNATLGYKDYNWNLNK